MPFFRRLLIALCAFAYASAALAMDEVGLTKDQPVLLQADEMGYDRPNATAIALGHVEATQGDTIVFADKVTYNQTTGVVHATGNVSMLQPSGDVFFSEDTVLKDDMSSGVIQQFRARLKDNSLFAAREADRISPTLTVLHQAVYSPCKLCEVEEGETPSAPLWQLRAEKVNYDEAAKRVKYKNLWLETYGVPVFYTPYFSHPTPDAESESGLLTPEFFHSSDLGNVVRVPLYVSFAPNTDMTITPWYVGNETPLLAGEYRHLSEKGFYNFHAAYTQPEKRDINGNLVPGGGTEGRGYIEAHGKYDLGNDWDLGFDGKRSTDNTFLLRYRFSNEDMLLSRLYAERIKDRSYAVVESLAFQGLRVQDTASASPYILPQASYHYESDPMENHSRFLLDSNALVLARKEGDEVRRISVEGGWRLPVVTAGGHVMEAKASARADGYSISEQPLSSTPGNTFSGGQGRFIPEVELNWRFPLIKRFAEGRSLMIAPVVEAVASPLLHPNAKIPNEDSQISELSDINLFSNNRYTGYDQVESGIRGTFGMRGHLQLADEEYVSWLLGQAWKESADNKFPLTTSLGERLSDYVGHILLKYDAIDLAYRFRFDRDTLEAKATEIGTRYSQGIFNLELNYISLLDEPFFGERKEVYGNAGFSLTPNWMLIFTGRRDLGTASTSNTPTPIFIPQLNPLTSTAGTVGLGAGLIFHNECIMVTSMLGRSYINLQDVQPSTTFSVKVSFKNLGSGETK